MKSFEFEIKGQVPSKANSYKIIMLSGHGSLAKTQALKNYERNFFAQCPCRNAMIEGFFKISIDVFFQSMKSDVDNSLKILLDCLQVCKVIKNDNKCMEIHVRKFKDAENPRCIIKLEEVLE